MHLTSQLGWILEPDSKSLLQPGTVQFMAAQVVAKTIAMGNYIFFISKC